MFACGFLCVRSEAQVPRPRLPELLTKPPCCGRAAGPAAGKKMGASQLARGARWPAASGGLARAETHLQIDLLVHASPLRTRATAPVFTPHACLRLLRCPRAWKAPRQHKKKWHSKERLHMPLLDAARNVSQRHATSYSRNVCTCLCSTQQGTSHNCQRHATSYSRNVCVEKPTQGGTFRPGFSCKGEERLLSICARHSIWQKQKQRTSAKDGSPVGT